MVFLFLCSKIYHMVVIQIDNTVLNLAVRCLDKAKVINLGINAKR